MHTPQNPPHNPSRFPLIHILCLGSLYYDSCSFVIVEIAMSNQNCFLNLLIVFHIFQYRRVDLRSRKALITLA